MKKSDLKELIKPLVKECIHEVLIEEGLLSNVVSEVAKGMQGALIVEKNMSSPKERAIHKRNNAIDTSEKLKEQRKKMMDAIGRDSYNGVNLFEGTVPESQANSQPGATDLGASNDPGVDISSLIGGASNIWNAMK